ncbi:hypothetical protein PORY_002111, partial [Pneumocystis oryctolagi]
MSSKLTKKFRNSTLGISLNRIAPLMSPDKQTAQKSPQNTDFAVNPGVLSVTVVEAVNLSLPPGVSLPELSVERHSYSMDQKNESQNRSLSFPYLVLEFDKNQVLVDALAGSSTICHPRWEYKVNFDVLKSSQLSIQCYLRRTQVCKGDSSGNYIYLGGVKFIPNFSEISLTDEWMPIHGGTGQIRLQ